MAEELIKVNLISKELLFGFEKTSVSSLDLLAAAEARMRFGAVDANSELVDDMLFKSCNTNASKSQVRVRVRG
jgi:hypothetical protein